MDTEIIRASCAPADAELHGAAQKNLQMLSEQYAGRGLAKAVKLTAAEQMQREAETAALAPEAYRLSSMPEARLRVYRRGKETMSAGDVLNYFGEARAEHLRTVDLESNTGIDECTGGLVKKTEERALTEVPRKHPVRGVAAFSKRTSERLLASLPVWFDRSAPDTSSDRRRFPLSAMAAMAAVTVSLLLIVASSVMLRLAESDVSRLKTQISEKTVAAQDLQSDFEVRNDLLQIRRIATEEYGMISEEYLKTDYVFLRSEDQVEAFEEERERSVGLSALLSAIGLK